MHRRLNGPFLTCMFLLTLLLCGCGNQKSPPPADHSSQDKANASSEIAAKAADSESSSEGQWDNTPKVLVPATDGAVTFQEGGLEIDASHTENGYIMSRYTGSADKVKFFVITPDDVRYTYDLPASESYAVLPLTGGEGTYTLDVREHVQDKLYSNLFKQTIDVKLKDEFQPFLYPNQYTWFTSDTRAVAKASELADGASNTLDVITAIYDYVITNVAYDDEKARTVQSGYLPNVDDTLDTGKGICFDYAALMTAMLRSQGIPTKLEIGYSGEIYHAWISTYSTETGWINDIIQFDGKSWALMDPTLGATNDASDLRDYIGDGTNYTVKYSR
ncbi:transglutaminase-like domain-containing protein [Roseburia hominis]